MEENEKGLYFACERIRLFLFIKLWHEKNLELCQGSKIHSLIHQGKFDELFKNPDWHTFLEAAGNLNQLDNYPISNHLRTICKAYPEAEIHVGVV